jgi:hypothetical protein
MSNMRWAKATSISSKIEFDSGHIFCPRCGSNKTKTSRPVPDGVTDVVCNLCSPKLSTGSDGESINIHLFSSLHPDHHRQVALADSDLPGETGDSSSLLSIPETVNTGSSPGENEMGTLRRQRSWQALFRGSVYNQPDAAAVGTSSLKELEDTT